MYLRAPPSSSTPRGAWLLLGGDRERERKRERNTGGKQGSSGVEVKEDGQVSGSVVVVVLSIGVYFWDWSLVSTF